MFDQAMFADSMLEVSRAQRSRRSWTTLTSFALEALAIGLLLLLPLWKTVGLPKARTVSTPITAGRPGPASASRPHTGSASPTPRSSVSPIFVASGRVPRPISTSAAADDAAPQLAGGGDTGIEGTGLPGGGGGLPPSLLGGSRPVLPAAPAPTIRAFKTSTMLEGSLIRRVQPVYPYPAKVARVQGPVVLFAVISKAGTIDNLRVVSGHPLLAPAAIDAVSQWRYRPYILNNEPIEVETQITVNFILGN
jgi:periplasmic protein TonB